MSNIIIPFIIGFFFGGFIVTILFNKFPPLANLSNKLLDNYYKKQNNQPIIKIKK